MRLGKITAVSPRGASIVVDASNTEPGLIVVPFNEAGTLIAIRDMGLPLQGEDYRLMAIVAADWALVYDWEYTTPPPAKQP